MLLISGSIVHEKIYESRTSTLYRGIQQSSNQPVVLKVLNGDYPNPDQIARFRREFEITNSFQSNNIVRVLGLENYNKSLVMILEDFGGISLADLIENNEFNIKDSLELGIKITDILGEIHQNNVIYKDLNPSNVIINTETGTVKIIDFSISTKISLEHPEAHLPEMLEGTLAYVSPEQTGRVNRSLDYRTDLYSLGVTLYQLFTGGLPFQVDDPLELLHFHIAVRPISPSKINKNVPESVAHIILKLMAKTAEERYQSCMGVKEDLQKCLTSLNTFKTIPEFTLGQKDITATLKIDRTLYGREEELQKLSSLVEAVRDGHSRLLFLSGYSGVGKSSLIYEIQNPIVKQGGYFTSGKCDQAQTTIPLAPIIHGLQKFIGQVLMESKESIVDWKEKLNKAFGVNGQVILDIIPEIELITGPQQPVAAIGPVEAENRFNLVFKNLVRACSDPQAPLVFFLDDMQWVDIPTLKLVEILLTDHTLSGFLVICSYRDNEVSRSHPLSLLIERFEQKNMEFQTIHLKPLQTQDVTNLLSDSLYCTPEISAPLAHICMKKTGGNPFFLKQFLHTLSAEGHLFFDPEQTAWRWNIDTASHLDVTANLADLMVGRLKKLPLNCQKALQLAACIGSVFDIQILSFINGKSTQKTLNDLQESLQKGFITSANDLYRYGFQQAGLHLLGQDHRTTRPVFKFAHDQIQHASYSLITSEEHKKELHLTIGRFMLKNATESELEKKLLDIVNHLNYGSTLIENPEEKNRLSRLNLQAGKSVKGAASYILANRYIGKGLELLDENCWGTQYDLTLSLSTEGAETAYLCGRYQEMERLFTTVVDHARSVLDKVGVYEVRVRAMKAQNNPSEAVDTGLEILHLLGLPCSRKPNTFTVASALIKTWLLLLNKSTDDLLNLPEMKDPYKLAAMTFLWNIGTAAYYTYPKLVPIISYMAIKLSLKYGNSYQATLMGYPTYGLLQCGLSLGNIDKGYELGQLSLKIQDKLHKKPINPSTFYLVNNLIVHWKEHIRNTLSPLQETYNRCLDIGELEIAANSAYAYCYRLYFIGGNLKDAKKELGKYREALEQFDEKIPLYRLRIFQQAIENLGTEEKNPEKLAGDYYDEDIMIPIHLNSNDRTTFFIVYLVKLVHSVLFQKYTDALAYSRTAEKHLDSVTASIFVPIYNFYDSLARLALYENSSPSEHLSIKRKVKTNQKRMKKWARHAPSNYLHKLYLVDAELARIAGRNERAMKKYDLAIQYARENEYLQEEAIACELAARFYLKNQQEHIAKCYMREARYCYEMWGSTSKCNQLDADEKHSFPLAAQRHQSIITSAWDDTSTIFSEANSKFDLMSVVKASRALTSEIVLSDLLTKMLHIMMESAGARKGFLVFPEKGEWQVKALGDIRDNELRVTTDLPTDLDQHLPTSIINYVTRTRTDVILNDACSEGLFVNDNYIVRNKSKSILCIPILHQGAISCILFLENNLTTGTFYHYRQKLLKLIGAQAAISLRNSNLYTELSHTIDQLHSEMEMRKETQLQLLHAEKLSALGSLSASIAHEFGNPMMGIKYLLDDIKKRLAVTDDDHKLIGLGLDECSRMKSLINNLQQFNRPSSGKNELVDIHHIVDNILVFHKKHLQTNKIKIVKHYDRTIPQTMAVEDQLAQVFINLILNASEAMPEEGGTITLTTSRTVDTISIEVQDTGVGIDPNDQGKIFEPFFSTKTEVEGTGLGLSVSYRIIATHKGRLTFSSQPGEGTTFTVSLPIVHGLE